MIVGQIFEQADTRIASKPESRTAWESLAQRRCETDGDVQALSRTMRRLNRMSPKNKEMAAHHPDDWTDVRE
jgi:hypothetical protein